MAVCCAPSTFCIISAFRFLDPTFGSHPHIHWTSLRVPVWVPPSSPLWFDDRPRPRIPTSSTRTLDTWAPRTRPYPEFSFLLLCFWCLFCLHVWFCLLLLHLYWYLFSPHFGFLHLASASVLTSSVCLYFDWCLLLPVQSWSLFDWPFPSRLGLNTRCGGSYSLISSFRIATSSTPLSWSFGMNFVIIRRPPCGLHGLHKRLSREG